MLGLCERFLGRERLVGVARLRPPPEPPDREPVRDVRHAGSGRAVEDHLTLALEGVLDVSEHGIDGGRRNRMVLNLLSAVWGTAVNDALVDGVGDISDRHLTPGRDRFDVAGVPLVPLDPDGVLAARAIVAPLVARIDHSPDGEHPCGSLVGDDDVTGLKFSEPPHLIRIGRDLRLSRVGR